MSPQAGWILVNEVIPRITASIPRTVKAVGAEDTEELIQDATAMAAKLLVNAEASGKQVTPGNIAYYTLQHAKSGRRSVGYSNADVMGSATQLNGRSRVSSFDEPVVVDDEPCSEFTVNDVFAADQDDPSVAAARKLDWDSFCSRQDTRTMVIIRVISEGESLTRAAEEIGLSYCRVRELREKIAVALLEFMGADVLTESIRKPAWKDGIVAAREKQECRYQRSAQ